MLYGRDSESPVRTHVDAALTDARELRLGEVHLRWNTRSMPAQPRRLKPWWFGRPAVMPPTTAARRARLRIPHRRPGYQQGAALLPSVETRTATLSDQQMMALRAQALTDGYQAVSLLVPGARDGRGSGPCRRNVPVPHAVVAVQELGPTVLWVVDGPCDDVLDLEALLRDDRVHHELLHVPDPVNAPRGRRDLDDVAGDRTIA